MYDWNYVLGPNKNWAGAEWAKIVCHDIIGMGINPEFLLTGGPGLLNTEAWLFKDFFPSMNIIGCEPQPDRYKNIKDDFPGELHKVALAGEVGEIKGWMGHPSGETDFKLNTIKENQRHYKKEAINCVTIDSILENFHGPGLVWLDIEGAELSAVRGAIKSMLNAKIFGFSIELSFEDHLCENSLTLIDMLFKFGYIAIGSSGDHVRQEYNSPELSFNYLSMLVVDTDNIHNDVFFLRSPRFAHTLAATDNLYLEVCGNYS